MFISERRQDKAGLTEAREPGSKFYKLRPWGNAVDGLSGDSQGIFSLLFNKSENTKTPGNPMVGLCRVT